MVYYIAKTLEIFCLVLNALCFFGFCVMLYLWSCWHLVFSQSCYIISKSWGETGLNFWDFWHMPRRFCWIMSWNNLYSRTKILWYRWLLILGGRCTYDNLRESRQKILIFIIFGHLPLLGRNLGKSFSSL